jgi:ribonuclease HII
LSVSLSYERGLWKSGIRLVAGVDEAGRGPLAGPVVAAAVILPQETVIKGVDDSKKLSAAQRDDLFEKIHRVALAVGVGIASHLVIDEINILQATMRAMADAVAKLHPAPEYLLVDGNLYYNKGVPYQTIVEGDAQSCSIAAASIVAKVTRDRIMCELDERYPEYGFKQHKGYCTPQHLAAITQFGRCEIHRKSFKVRSIDEFENQRALEL